MKVAALVLTAAMLAVALGGTVAATDGEDTIAFLIDFGDGRTYWVDVPREKGMNGYDVFTNVTEKLGFTETHITLDKYGHQIMSIEGYGGNYNFSNPNAPYDFWRLLRWDGSTDSWVWTDTLLDGIDLDATKAIAFIYTRWTYMGPPASTPDDRDSWITERGDYSNTGSVLSYSPSSVDLQWSKDLGNGAVDAPAIYAAGNTYAVTSGTKSGDEYTTNATVMCLDSAGDEVWSEDVGKGHHVAAPMYWNGFVYVPSADGKLYAINGETGFTRWSYDTGTSPDGITSSPVMYQNLIIVANADGNVVALDQSGALKWSKKLPTGVSSSPAVRNGILLVGGDDGTLYALSGDGKRQEWSVPLGDSISGAPITTEDQVLVPYSEGDNGGLASISYEGSVDWTAEIDGTPSMASLTPEGAAVVSSEGLTLVDLNGTAQWTADVDGASAGSSVVAVNGMSYVVTGGESSKVVAVDNEGKVAWTEDAGSSVSASPSLVNGTMLLPSSGGSLLSFSFVDLQREPQTNGNDNGNDGSTNGNNDGSNDGSNDGTDGANDGSKGIGGNLAMIGGVVALALIVVALLAVRWRKRKS